MKSQVVSIAILAFANISCPQQLVEASQLLDESRSKQNVRSNPEEQVRGLRRRGEGRRGKGRGGAGTERNEQLAKKKKKGGGRGRTSSKGKKNKPSR